MAFPENVDDGVTLELRDVDVGPDALSFTYVVENGSSFDAYLVNRLFHRREGRFDVDPNLVYSDIGDDGVLYLRKQMLEVPEELDVEAPEVPYVTLLAAGERFFETIHVDVPVHPHAPYRPQAAEIRIGPSGFVFVLGYVLGDGCLSAEESPELRISYTGTRRCQKLKLFRSVGVKP